MLYDFLKTYQLDVMLILSGVCMIQALFVILSKTLKPRRRFALVLMNVCGMFLLLSDRYAYIYRGNTSTLGFYMVRICNFLVYFFIMTAINCFTLYLADLYTTEGNLKKIPTRLRICELLYVCGVILLIIGSTTGLYYYFDDQNRYVRGPLFLVCYVFPFLSVFVQLTVIIQYRKLVNKIIFTSLALFVFIPIVSTCFQIVFYGLSLTNISFVGMIVVVYVFSLLDMNETAAKANRMEIELLKKGREDMSLLFEQTAEALAAAIDAKDPYTHGHSARVAEYSEKIARLAGYTEEQCKEVYFSALLHDVGKIGIPDTIITKDGSLEDWEYEEIKKHPTKGSQILSGISQSPYLSIGASYHHERYDGKGYPERLKGEDIPEIARIIAVADAYDAMTSKRSYRSTIPQMQVREELVKGMGTQFDPTFAKIMIHLIDEDSEYVMQERDEKKEIKCDMLDCREHRSAYSEGIWVNRYPVHIHLRSQTDADAFADDCIASMILFDSLDARIHNTEAKKESMAYYEYGEIWLNGNYSNPGIRKVATDSKFKYMTSVSLNEERHVGIDYDISAVRYGDHALIKISNEFKEVKLTLALPDSSRFMYIGLTGKQCTVTDVRIERDQEMIGFGYINRIADKISYIKGRDGDLPNIQIDGSRSATTKGTLINRDFMNITFHSMSLPTARLVWHCPYIVLYTSEGGLIDGVGYKEYGVIRMDGECWQDHKHSENTMLTNRTEEFGSWNEWKSRNKRGVDCRVRIERRGNVIKTYLDCAGLISTNTTTIFDNVNDIYFALTGDQCALTNIRIS